MATALSKLTERIAAMEEEMALMKMSASVSSMTEGLRLATPEEAKEWVETAQTILALYGSASVGKSLKTEKTEKTAKTATNPGGPSEWNVFVQSTWQEMAAEKGVLMGDGEDAKALFKKQAAAAGVSYQSAMKEAGRRKDVLEGRDTNEKQAKKVAAKEKRDAKKSAAPTAVKKAAAPVKKTTEAEDLMAELGIVVKEIDGISYMVCDDGEAFAINEDGTMGERAGVYDADSNTIE